MKSVFVWPRPLHCRRRDRRNACKLANIHLEPHGKVKPLSSTRSFSASEFLPRPSARVQKHIASRSLVAVDKGRVPYRLVLPISDCIFVIRITRTNAVCPIHCRCTPTRHIVAFLCIAPFSLRSFSSLFLFSIETADIARPVETKCCETVATFYFQKFCCS